MIIIDREDAQNKKKSKNGKKTPKIRERKNEKKNK